MDTLRQNPQVAPNSMRSTSRRIIRVCGVAKRVSWWVGLVLLLPSACGWFSHLPADFFTAFPYPVSFTSGIWMSRILISTYTGFACWLLVTLFNIASIFITSSSSVHSPQPVAVKVLVAVVTLLIFVASGAGLLFMSIDVSNIPR